MSLQRGEREREMEKERERGKRGGKWEKSTNSFLLKLQIHFLKMQDEEKQNFSTF